MRVPANARTGVARGNGDQARAGGASPGDTTARPEPPPIFRGRAPAGRPAGRRARWNPPKGDLLMGEARTKLRELHVHYSAASYLIYKIKI